MTIEQRTREAFIEAYRMEVGNADRKDLEAFFADWDDDTKRNKMSPDNHPYYTSIMDAWGVFEAGMRWRQRLANSFEMPEEKS